MKFLIKGIKVLATVIIMVVISSLLVVAVSSAPKEGTIHETIKVDKYDINVNISARGKTYYMNHESILNNNEAVVIGFAIIELTHEHVYLTIENKQEIILVTVSKDYRATIVRNLKP